MTNMIVVGLVVAMIVSPTLCYPSHRQEVKNEWFRTESPVAEGAEKDWFQPPTAVEDEDVFEMEDAEIDVECGTEIYVMAFTSGVRNAGSDHSPDMTIELKTPEKTKKVHLYNRPGDDMYPNKGDLWEFKISSLEFSTDKCIQKSDIKEIIIHSGGNDGWNIESIVTILHSANSYQVLTANMHVNRWVDSNEGKAKLQYVLTNV